ncbi:DUF3093 domain-containing protein [Ruicaihuangia caeni]|uniref:DUF3093 domain-containing protein n=1 Tax=Ruicaihuangia caeni TaxID=3042517 RepID=A0AAW6T9J2_9MICO|nr:DUF3093 domain-containing protein [Klugiella sp. YN-L-19]MDI2098025.1 DUF3093 domain-containing protein [Klugiella sp. YN-L-19]
MTLYRERLWPSAWIYLACALVIPATILLFMPINVGVGVATAVVLYAGCVVLLIAASPTIEVAPDELRAGSARIPISLTGEVRSFYGDEATHERGPGLDARAWLMVRGWVSPVVRVEVLDEHDPVPYWLLSTRRPEEVAAAIAGAKTAA